MTAEGRGPGGGRAVPLPETPAESIQHEHETPHRPSARVRRGAPLSSEREEREGGPTIDARRIRSAVPAYEHLLRSLRGSQVAAERYRRRQSDLAEQLASARAEAEGWRARCRELESAIGFRVLGRFRTVVERLAPEGTVRRRAYRRLVSSLVAYRRVQGSEVPSAAPITVDFHVPMALEPDASIIVPVHDHWETTEACLRSVAADVSAVGYEVIVVDDASNDETPDMLAAVDGVRTVRLPDNRGFVHAVNAGLAVARGGFVVLLNNDTKVRPGWLDALVGTAEADLEVGVVGPKLVYPDGRLQEAGGIIWQDASGHNYGRDQDASDPAYNFLRDVDYCSGACMLVRRELLKLLGGLDTRFSPAYYEDTDLCFAARAHGYRVVYQPEAVVEHLEGASHGTDTSSGIKRHQVVHQAVFREKWSGALADHGQPQPEQPRLSSWRNPSGRALVIDHQIPMPDHDSGSRRMFELLRVLRGLGFGVTFAPQNGTVIPRYREALSGSGIEVLRGPQDLDPYVRAVAPELHLVVMSRPTVAWANLPMMRSLLPDAVLVFDTVDLHFLRERRRASIDGDLSALKSAKYHHDIEMTLARLTDETWVVSEEEAQTLLDEEPGISVSVVPNIHPDEPPGLPFDHREGILFVGNYAHHPNRDAARWLRDEILPIVRRSVPDIPVFLVGSHPTDEIRELEGDGVAVLGWVPHLEELYGRARLFVAPLRYGAGMKGKIGESLGYGLPVVTTSIGAEGMRLLDGEELLVREDAESLAQAVVDAYRDRDLWERLAERGRLAVREHFSPSQVRGDLATILTRLGVEVATG